MENDVKGLTTIQVVLLFLAGVAVCAVFFSAGFLVGYNQRVPSATPVTENVTTPSDIPPVASEASSGPSAASAPAGAPTQPVTTSEDQAAPLRPQPLATASGGAPKPAAKTESPSLPGSAPASAAVATPGSVTEPKHSRTSQPEAGDNFAAGFSIQVAATGTLSDAEKMVKALRSLTYPATILTPVQAHSNDNLYRVLVGPYDSRDLAVKARDKLIQDGFKQPFIKH